MRAPLPLDVDACAALVMATRWITKVAEADEQGCRIWVGARVRGGYGTINIGGGRMVLAHRVAFVASAGVDLPGDKILDHLCRNRACVEPNHLEAVTPRENTRRGRAPSVLAGASSTCPSGHVYADEPQFQKNGTRRICAPCRRRRTTEHNNLITAAAAAAGMQRRAYIGRYGSGRAVAEAFIAGAPVPGVAR